MKGIIALDLDGTVTQNPEILPQSVASYLQQLSKTWQIAFITGRSFTLAWNLLSSLKFPYHLAVQNGACLLQMPERVILGTHYLSAEMLPSLEAIGSEEGVDFVIYGGIEREDVCFFRPQMFSERMQVMFEKRCEKTAEVWKPVPDFSTLPLKAFPTVKFFGSKKLMEQVAKKLESRLYLHAPLIADPFLPGIYLVQASTQEANKGQVVRDLRKRLNHSVVIAAGDDHNDHEMLEEADIRLVMDRAPAILREKVKTVVLPSTEKGLIEGLDKVTQEKFWRDYAR